MPKDKVAVVIPVYRHLTMHENISFTQCTKILKNYSIILIKPQSFQLVDSLKEFQSISFDDNYFKNIEGYNKLMLLEKFYSSFFRF